MKNFQNFLEEFKMSKTKEDARQKIGEWDRAVKAEQVELNSIVEICELFPK